MPAIANRFDARTACDLPLREKIAQLICVRIGSNMQPPRTVEQDEERVARLLAQCFFGGLVLFNGGPGTKHVLHRLQRSARIPLLVGSDIERGVGQQVQGFSLFPHAMAFGRLGESAGDAAIHEFAEILAHEAGHVGIHATFGPVADVATNPRNPIISTRAFSDNPERAARLVALYVESVQSCGLHATAKHFPGHGETELDSHSTLPIVRKSVEQLAACELMPFQAAIDAGCRLVMTAHVSYPALDPSGTPATLSPLMLRTLLREQMGFRGVICSDSLLMAGVRNRFNSEGEMACAALKAGVDLLLDLGDPLAVVDDLCRRVDDGTLSCERIDESVQRVAALKAMPLGIGREVSSRLNVDSVATQAIELVRHSSRRPLPLDSAQPVTAILLSPLAAQPLITEQPLAAALRDRFRAVDYTELGPSSPPDQYRRAETLALGASQLLVALIVRPAAWQAFGLRPEQHTFVQSLLWRRDDAVVASLGVPSVLADFPEAAASVCTYSDVPASQRALVEFLVRRGNGSLA